MTWLPNVRADVAHFVDHLLRSEGEVARSRAERSAVARAACVARVLASQYALQALLAYRFGRWVRSLERRREGKVVAALLRPAHAAAAAYVRAAYDIDLDPSAEIGPGLFISHVGGLRVRGCRIGAGCTIGHRVHIEPLPGKSEGPVVGDAVWIGPHVTIRGRIRVGDRATVATGAVVQRDVAAGTMVGGAPARVVSARYENAGLI